MPNPRTPLAKAEATGRTTVNPGRFKNRKEPKSKPLGKASPHLDELERKVWEAFKREVPWLTEADRTVVESACILRAKLWAGSKADTTIGKLLSLLGQIGATPASRSKVHVQDEGEADAADEFLQ
jgi:hypothetical protein